MSTAEEQVLVLPARVLHGLGHFDGFTPRVEAYLPGLLGCGELCYRPRGEMEEDPTYKQLIPYAIFRHIAAGGVPMLLNYRRGGGAGETRLRAKRSVGVGGHISTVDGDARQASAGVYRRGLERELAEEIEIDTPATESCIGLINDEQTPVGRVHLGVVHLFDLERPAVSAREDDIQDVRFTALDRIAADLDRYESWSQIAVRALIDLAAAGSPGAARGAAWAPGSAPPAPSGATPPPPSGRG